MAKKYIRINFKNAPSAETPLDEVTLNKMDAGIDELDTWRNGLIVDNLASELTDKALSAKQGSVLDKKVTTLNESLTTKIIYKHIAIGDIQLNANTRNNYTISDYYVTPSGYKIIACTPMVSGASSGDYCFSNVVSIGSSLDIGMVTFANKSTTTAYTWNLSFMLVLIKTN